MDRYISWIAFFLELWLTKPIYLPKRARHHGNGATGIIITICHREGGNFDWFRNNLGTAADSPTESNITAKWTFDGQMGSGRDNAVSSPNSFSASTKSWCIHSSNETPLLKWYHPEMQFRTIYILARMVNWTLREIKKKTFLIREF